jgi:hypothetical protein
MKAAIIGTRGIKNPERVYEKIQNYIKKNDLKIDLFVSGNAEGTDQIANRFVPTAVLHFLPWASYNKHLQQLDNFDIFYVTNVLNIFDEQILELFPHMKNQSQGVWNLIRRNFQIILGEYGSQPVDIVFFHIEGELKGGTRYGVLLAKENNILCVLV